MCVCVCGCVTDFTPIQSFEPQSHMSSMFSCLPSCVDSLASENLSISPVCPRRGLNPPHRVKSISMTTFSQQEVEFLQNHGNEVGELSPFGWVTATDV